MMIKNKLLGTKKLQREKKLLLLQKNQQINKKKNQFQRSGKICSLLRVVVILCVFTQIAYAGVCTDLKVENKKLNTSWILENQCDGNVGDKCKISCEDPKKEFDSDFECKENGSWETTAGDVLDMNYCKSLCPSLEKKNNVLKTAWTFQNNCDGKQEGECTISCSKPNKTHILTCKEEGIWSETDEEGQENDIDEEAMEKRMSICKTDESKKSESMFEKLYKSGILPYVLTFVVVVVIGALIYCCCCGRSSQNYDPRNHEKNMSRDPKVEWNENLEYFDKVIAQQIKKRREKKLEYYKSLDARNPNPDEIKKRQKTEAEIQKEIQHDSKVYNSYLRAKKHAGPKDVIYQDEEDGMYYYRMNIDWENMGPINPKYLKKDQKPNANESVVHSTTSPEYQLNSPELTDLPQPQKTDFKDDEIIDWSTEQVCGWIQTVAPVMGLYLDNIRKEAIDGHYLCHVPPEDLVDMGFSKAHANRILIEVQKLTGQQLPEKTPPAEKIPGNVEKVETEADSQADFWGDDIEDLNFDDIDALPETENTAATLNQSKNTEVETENPDEADDFGGFF